MKPHEKDLFPAAMLGDLQEVQHAEESGLSREFRRNIREANIFDAIHNNLPIVHGVSAAHLHVRTHPDTHAAGNFSVSYTFSQAFGKEHGLFQARESPLDFIQCFVFLEAFEAGAQRTFSRVGLRYRVASTVFLSGHR